MEKNWKCTWERQSYFTAAPNPEDAAEQHARYLIRRLSHKTNGLQSEFKGVIEVIEEASTGPLYRVLVEAKAVATAKVLDVTHRMPAPVPCYPSMGEPSSVKPMLPDPFSWTAELPKPTPKEAQQMEDAREIGRWMGESARKAMDDLVFGVFANAGHARATEQRKAVRDTDRCTGLPPDAVGMDGQPCPSLEDVIGPKASDGTWSNVPSNEEMADALSRYPSTTYKPGKPPEVKWRRKSVARNGEILAELQEARRNSAEAEFGKP